MKEIPFNKPHLTGKETKYIKGAVKSGKISGNGHFTQKCQQFFEKKYSIGKALLTSSCTDALEMAAILCKIKPGDEVIIPSYTFVSTANAFILRGAKIVFCDSKSNHPGIDEKLLDGLISKKTKAIVVVHYAGIACDMEKIMDIAERYNLIVVEDAAQAINSYYTFTDGSKKALGSIGHLAAFSFHETKNIIAGEGGLLSVNDLSLANRAEIIWEKGTNRAAFFRGEVDQYGWIDIGSSFLASEVTAAFLWAQLENLDQIQKQRENLWKNYNHQLTNLNYQKPFIPGYASNNAHIYYLMAESVTERNALIKWLRKKGIHAVFHYLCLHKSEFFLKENTDDTLPQAERYADCLVRLPLYYDLTPVEQQKIIDTINQLA